MFYIFQEILFILFYFSRIFILLFFDVFFFSFCAIRALQQFYSRISTGYKCSRIDHQFSCGYQRGLTLLLFVLCQCFVLFRFIVRISSMMHEFRIYVVVFFLYNCFTLWTNTGYFIFKCTDPAPYATPKEKHGTRDENMYQRLTSICKTNQSLSNYWSRVLYTITLLDHRTG